MAHFTEMPLHTHSVWVQFPQVTKLKTCPNMTQALEPDVRPPTLTFDTDSTVALWVGL